MGGVKKKVHKFINRTGQDIGGAADKAVSNTYGKASQAVIDLLPHRQAKKEKEAAERKADIEETAYKSKVYGQKITMSKKERYKKRALEAASNVRTGSILTPQSSMQKSILG